MAESCPKRLEFPLFVDELATKAMSLSGEARALLAEKLVESLDQELVRDIWLSEAKRRRDEVRSGQVKPMPGIDPISSYHN
ncbi:MAG: addiction module protein [Desulfobacteraceae bacterium]|nr:addiction module protein [Actinomycetota bacterium]MCG2830336.1 addiction module protein [Desulfobacteraceae bacterium]